MNRTIRLGNVPEQEWDDLQAKGFDCLWLMGLSPLGRRIARQHPDLQKEYAKALPGWKESDVVGSPSSVRAYQLDPELGSWEQLEKVLKKLHDRGIKLILDYNGREKGDWDTYPTSGLRINPKTDQREKSCHDRGRDFSHPMPQRESGFFMTILERGPSYRGRGPAWGMRVRWC
jgi:hypothetical protein